MSLNLRKDEQIINQARIHWSSYVLSGTWAFIGILPLIGLITNKEGPNSLSSTLFFLGLFFGPLLYRIISNRFKIYILTNDRVYIAEGIISRKTVNIPLEKINDVHLSQGIIQRMFQSGDVKIFTGHDLGPTIKDIEKAASFKDDIYELTSKAGKNK